MAAETSKALLDVPSMPSFPDSLLVCGTQPPLLTRAQRGAAPEASEAKTLATALPRSRVLTRVKDFLGVIAEANSELELAVRERTRAEYDVEVLSGNEEYIEMDLLLGVADLRTAEAVAAAEAAVSGLPQSLPLVCSGLSDSDDGSDDDEGATCLSKKHGCDSAISGRRNERAKIVVLNPASD